MTDYLGYKNNNLTLNTNIDGSYISSYINGKKNIPNLYLFDNETIVFPMNPQLLYLCSKIILNYFLFIA